jgi:hypothetical protein
MGTRRWIERFMGRPKSATAGRHQLSSPTSRPGAGKHILLLFRVRCLRRKERKVWESCGRAGAGKTATEPTSWQLPDAILAVRNDDEAIDE